MEEQQRHALSQIRLLAFHSMICGLVRSALLPINPQQFSMWLEIWRFFIKYAIGGSGKIGTALARTFARESIEVAIANTRGPEALASLTKELGRSVVPQSIQDACKAEMIFLAVPFPAHKDVAKQFKQWNGTIVVDVTNTLDLSPVEQEELGGLLSSEVVSKAFVGARVVKAFNHFLRNSWEPIRPQRGSDRRSSYQATMRTLAQLLWPLRLSLASLQSNSEGSIKAAYPFTFWAAALALFCLRIW